jgi:hypothetical protein
MALELVTVRKLQWPGKKTKWEFSDESIIKVGGREFIKLPRGQKNIPFVRMVFEDCASLTVGDNEEPTLTASRGYKQLIQLREKAQNAESDPDKDIPLLFRQLGAVPTHRKKHKPTRKEIQEMQKVGGSVTITIPARGDDPPLEFPVVKSHWSGAEIAVPLNAKIVERVIQFLQDEGFDESLKRRSRCELPKGVTRRDDKFLVKGKKTRMFATLDDAVAEVRRRESAQSDNNDGADGSDVADEDEHDCCNGGDGNIAEDCDDPDLSE